MYIGMRVLEAIYVAVIGISFLVSLSAFKLDFPFYLKFFSALLGVTFVVEVCAVYVVRMLSIHTNSPLYNTFMLVEFCAYAFYSKKILTSKKAGLFARITLIALPLCWLATTLFKFGLSKWNSYFLIAGSCCTIAFCLIYYVQTFRNKEPIRLLKTPEFVIAREMLSRASFTIFWSTISFWPIMFSWIFTRLNNWPTLS